VTEDSKHELARFLRSRRERIMPADVGLPAGQRRRAAGLRREEVAVLAGLSPTWYAYLEQGRDIHPSAEVLDSLARVLLLTEDERRYLHMLAYGHVRKPRALGDEQSAEHLVEQLVATAELSPNPVYGVNLFCDLIAWNPATVAYYTDFARLPGGRQNLMRWILEAPEARIQLPDWAEDARDLVARWRAMVANHEDSDRLQDLIAEFTRVNPEFGDWWALHDVQEHRSRIRRLRHPRLGIQSMRLIVVQATDFAPCVVVFHLPVPGNDAEPTKP
jgi:transcriptional regulator with XRE-family HTH domain